MLPELVEKGMDILRTTPETFVAIRMFLPIAFLNLLQGNHMVTDHLIKMFKWSADENSSPLGVSVFHAVFGFYGWLSGAFDDCVRIAEDACSDRETIWQQPVALSVPADPQRQSGP